MEWQGQAIVATFPLSCTRATGDQTAGTPRPRPPATTLWLIAGALATGVVAAIALARRQRSDDLGSVSAAWTTEHNIGDRSGDRSNG